MHRDVKWYRRCLGTPKLVLALLLVMIGAAPGTGSPREASSRQTSSPPDTLANGLPRGLARKLAPWVQVWRHAIPTFAPESLARAGTGPFAFGYAWAGLATGVARDMGDRALDEWSPDSTHYVNFDWYSALIRNEDGTIEISRDVDSAPVFADIKSDTLWQVAFCGTPCWFDGAYWLDADRFALTGVIESGNQVDAPRQAFLHVYDLDTRRATAWLGPTMEDSLLSRYQAASDSTLLARHR